MVGFLVVVGEDGMCNAEVEIELMFVWVVVVMVEHVLVVVGEDDCVGEAGAEMVVCVVVAVVEHHRIRIGD